MSRPADAAERVYRALFAGKGPLATKKDILAAIREAIGPTKRCVWCGYPEPRVPCSSYDVWKVAAARAVARERERKTK